MPMIKNISAALSVATTVLLVSCSSESTDSGPVPVANTLAPELVGSWKTACVATLQGTTTTTQASGGGGGGGASGGEAYRSSATFNQNGRVTFFNESYATSDCNANKLSGTSTYKAVYLIGDVIVASEARKIDIIGSNSTTYSIFQVGGATQLYLGDATNSSPGYDGSSDAARFDTLGIDVMLRQ